MGRRAADAVRDRVDKLVNKREVEVIDGDNIRTQLERAGYSPDTTFDLSGARVIGRFLRADEFLVAHVSSTPAGPRISGHLVLLRDEHLRQPLPDATAPNLDSAAHMFAKSLAAARLQLVPERRCENALRDGSALRAVAAAREGVTAFPASTIARTCLVWALRQSTGVSNELLAVSRDLLKVDSTNIHAIEGAAVALDSLKRRDEAATMWLKLADTDTANVDLALKISYALFDGANAKRAEPFITSLAERHPDDIRVTQQKWRIAYENKSWARALEAGEILRAQDPAAQGDSVFFLRLATAYHNANKQYKAIETLAHGVSAFPKDVRLYSLYTQYLRAEADSVLPRGLTLFPQSADLLALNAKELRSKGKLAESLDATKKAVELDSSMAQGRLTVAQLEIELGRPDSALVALHRAVSSGEDSSLVAQFALSKGNTFYRAANGTKISADFGLALRFLSFADSIRSTIQSKFLVGATEVNVVAGLW